MTDPEPAPRAPAPGESYCRVYSGLVQSGLLAGLPGNELKVLLALALEAHVLGGGAEAEHHFARLRAAHVVTAADRGRLYCYLDRATLAARSGLSVRSVSRLTEALAGRGLVEKRSVRSLDGRHHYNVYFIQPTSHLGKFAFTPHPTPPPGPPSACPEPGPPSACSAPPRPAPEPGPPSACSAPPHPEPPLSPPLPAGQEPRAAAVPHVNSSRRRGDENGKDPDRDLLPRDRRAPARPSPTAPPPVAPAPPGSTDQDTAMDAAMGAVYRQLERAGWPPGDAARLALRAKAIRVHDAARQQGADGPRWVADALLTALGRKVSPDGHRTPDAETLLAYADGILNNWIQRRSRPPAGQGAGAPAGKHSRAPAADRKPVKPAPPRREPGRKPLPDSLPSRPPRTEEQELWAQLLDGLRTQMPRATFDRLLLGSELMALDRPAAGAAHLLVQVNSPHAVDWLEHRLMPLLLRHVEYRLGHPANLTFRARGAPPGLPPPSQ